KSTRKNIKPVRESRCPLRTRVERPLTRSAAYYKPQEGDDGEELALMHLIDEIHVKHPLKDWRRITRGLQTLRELRVYRKWVRRLMLKMGISIIYPKCKTTKRTQGPGHEVFPYPL